MLLLSPLQMVNKKLLFTIIVLMTSLVLETVGSFLTSWAFTKVSGNKTTLDVDADAVVDVGIGLWTAKGCVYGVVCVVGQKRVKFISRRCTQNADGSLTCTDKTEYRLKNRNICRDDDKCATISVQEYDKVPSLLLVSKSFITPGIVSGVITIILYVVKIVLQLRSPIKRLHLKAAYLTFAAVAGAAVEVGVIIFCAMLNKDVYKLGWGPALPGVGGFLQLCIAFGGYLGWRNVGDDDIDDLSVSEKMDLERERKHFVPWTRSVSANSNSSCNATSTKV